MSRLRLIEGAADGPQPDGREPDPLPGAEALDAYSRTVTSVAERLRESVANLRVGRRTRRGRAEGGGSAVVITPDGYMLTSAHVVEGTDGRGQAAFPDGRSFGTEVVGTDPLSDLAVLRADAGNLAVGRPAGGERDPDRRGAQPRQLGRGACRRAGPGRRHQHSRRRGGTG